MRIYLDSSAIVKLVVDEGDANVVASILMTYLDDTPFTCRLTRTEVLRAVSKGGFVTLERAKRFFARLDIVDVSNEVFDRAATIEPLVRLRTLDALHLAAALQAGSELRGLVTFDHRLAEAARVAGVRPLPDDGSWGPVRNNGV